MALSTFVKEFFARIQLQGVTSSDVPISIEVEADGTPKTVNYGKASSTITAFAVETTGEQKNVLVGHDGAALQRLRTETTRELAASLYGTDSGGTVEPARVNDNDQLFYELYEHWKQVDPYQVTNADAIAYNPGSTAGETYSVVITVYVTAAVAATVTVYVDVAAGGTAGGNEYLMNAETIAAKTRVTLPEIIIGGDDDIRAFSATGSDAAVHFRVKQVART